MMMIGKMKQMCFMLVDYCQVFFAAFFPMCSIIGKEFVVDTKQRTKNDETRTAKIEWNQRCSFKNER